MRDVARLVSQWLLVWWRGNGRRLVFEGRRVSIRVHTTLLQLCLRTARSITQIATKAAATGANRITCYGVRLTSGFIISSSPSSPSSQHRPRGHIVALRGAHSQECALPQDDPDVLTEAAKCHCCGTHSSEAAHELRGPRSANGKVSQDRPVAPGEGACFCHDLSL